MADEKITLVTGASTGIGRATAALLARRGYRVFGTSRKPQESPGPYFRMLVLDVRSDESVRACVEQVLAEAGRIDLLVNNAGYAHVDPLEETSLAEARAVFETNFFGLVRVTNAVLPSMRGRRQGRIINLSSIAGLAGVPGEGFYSATKFAVEGYSEALRYEVEPLGIRVILVEPGLFKTAFRGSITTSNRPIADYAALAESIRRLYKEGQAIGADPSAWRGSSCVRPRRPIRGSGTWPVAMPSGWPWRGGSCPTRSLPAASAGSSRPPSGRCGTTDPTRSPLLIYRPRTL